TGSCPSRGERSRIDGRIAINASRPWAARNFGHPGEQSLIPPLAQENRTIVGNGNECRACANWLFRFGRLYRKLFRVAGFERHAIVIERTDGTSWTPRRAYGCAQIHHRL